MVAGFQDDLDSEDEGLTRGKVPAISLQQDIDISSDDDQQVSSAVLAPSVAARHQYDKRPKLPSSSDFVSPIDTKFDSRRTSSQSKQNSLDTTPKGSAKGDKGVGLGKAEANPGKVKMARKEESTESSEEEDLPTNVVVLNEEEDVEEEDSGNCAKNSGGVALGEDGGETARPTLYTLNLEDLDALERNYSGNGLSEDFCFLSCALNFG